jgi:hypothetical protein
MNHLAEGHAMWGRGTVLLIAVAIVAIAALIRRIFR